MSEMITERQSSEEFDRFDLFSSLLEANREDKEEDRLSQSELMGEP